MPAIKPTVTLPLLLALLLGGAPGAWPQSDDESAEPSTVTGLMGPGLESETTESEVVDEEDERIEPRIAAHERMMRLMDERRYPEAIEAASETLNLTEAEFGIADIRIVAPLNNLATLKMLNGDLIGSEANYLRSIAIIEQREGILSPRLINAYIGLGATYNRAKLYDQGAEAFERALRVNHVNDGFYNFEQFKIRDGLTESQVGLQDLEEANFQQEIQVEIQQRKLGEEDPEIVNGMYKLGRWYERSGQLDAARETYQAARRIIYKSSGKDDIAVVDALEGIASTYESQGLMAESANALKKALEIVESQPEPDSQRSAALLVRLGDLYTRFNKTRTARANYERAWQFLSTDEALLTLRDEYFSTPQRVGGLTFSALRFASGSRSGNDDLLEGYILLGYSVDDEGHPEDVRVIEADPAGLMDERVTSTMQRSWFRPRFEDGLPVATEGLIYRHDFRYRNETQQSPESSKKALEYPGGRLEYPDSPAEPE